MKYLIQNKWNVIILFFLFVFSFFPYPPYRIYKVSEKKFNNNRDLESILKACPYYYVKNYQAYFLFTQKANFIKIGNFAKATFFTLTYKAYPLNCRFITGNPILSIKFKNKENKFIKVKKLPTSFFLKNRTFKIPQKSDGSIYITTTSFNILDDCIFILKSVTYLKKFPLWLLIWEKIYNFKLYFFIFLSIHLSYLFFFTPKKKMIFLIFLFLIFMNYYNALPFEKRTYYYADAGSYSEWGKNFVKTFTIGKNKPSTGWPPIWPITLGIIETLFYQPESTILFMFFLRFIIILITAKIALLIFKNEKIAILSVLLFSLYPESYTRSRLFYAENLFIVFFLSFVYFYIKFRKTPKINYTYLILSSFFLLLAIHTKQEIFSYFIMLISLDIILKKLDIKKFTAFILIIILGCVPYIIRNYHLYHKFVFITTKFGQNLLMGNNPKIPKLKTNIWSNSFVGGEEAYKLLAKGRHFVAKNEYEIDKIKLKLALEYLHNSKNWIPTFLSKIKLYFLWKTYPLIVNLFNIEIPFLDFLWAFILGIFGFIFAYIMKKLSVESLYTMLLWIINNFIIAIVFFLRGERHRYMIMPIICIGISFLIYKSIILIKSIHE